MFHKSRDRLFRITLDLVWNFFKIANFTKQSGSKNQVLEVLSIRKHSGKNYDELNLKGKI